MCCVCVCFFLAERRGGLRRAEAAAAGPLSPLPALLRGARALLCGGACAFSFGSQENEPFSTDVAFAMILEDLGHKGPLSPGGYTSKDGDPTAAGLRFKQREQSGSEKCTLCADRCRCTSEAAPLLAEARPRRLTDATLVTGVLRRGGIATSSSLLFYALAPERCAPARSPRIRWLQHRLAKSTTPRRWMVVRLPSKQLGAFGTVWHCHKSAAFRLQRPGAAARKLAPG